MKKIEKNELKKAVEVVFETATRKARKAAGEAPLEMDEATFAALQNVWASVRGMVLALVRDGAEGVMPDAGFYDDVRTVLNFKGYILHEAWHLRENVTEAELRAAARPIGQRSLARLEGLRDQVHRLDYAVPLSNANANYSGLVNNLRFFAGMMAHVAKHKESPRAGRFFLRAESILQKVLKQVFPRFVDNQIDEVLENLQSGFEELQLDADYEGLEDWSAYCKRQKALVEALARQDEGAAQ